MSPKIDMEWLRAVPKVELHLHMEGAIPLEALWELLKKYGGDPFVPDFGALEKRFEYRDFSHFIDTWKWKNGFLRQYDDFTFIAQAMAKDLAAQNIRYAEVFFSPTDFSRHGLGVCKIAEAIRMGLSRVPQTEIALVADLVRDHGPERASRTLAEINEVRGMGVIGIGIGGSEHEYPPELFEGVYEEARQLGFKTSAHAGEAAGPESIWGAIRALRVDRIGHGTHASMDEELLEYLASSEITLEMCPISNVKTKVVNSVSEHPIGLFFRRGIKVTINTDDPAMFGNSLHQEFVAVQEELGFSEGDVRALILQGIRSSWLPDDRKASLEKEFVGDPSWTP